MQHVVSLLVSAVIVAATTPLVSSSRDVFAMTKWAKQQGIVMHKNLQWKQYNNDDDDNTNWGLELSEPVLPGTTLLQVPKDLVLDANCIREEYYKNSDNKAKLKQALDKLGDFRLHEDGFLIFIKLLRCSKDGNSSKWAPWIQGMPTKFPDFSNDEIQCLPFYAKYAAEYQKKKSQAFCQAAAELGDYDENDSADTERLHWAFHAVGSRFWKTEPLEEEQDQTSNTELVPVGDMFNHREPPNVAITHSDNDGSVNFVYKGDADNKNNRDLYITYGQPSNPHRFLAIFGFVPDMPYVWSHVAYPDNPFSAKVPEMVFGADGSIPKIVWDAVLYALLQPPPGQPTPEYTKEQHAKYKKFTLDVLQNHVIQQLQELKTLRQKMETTKGDNMALIRQHNDFLTRVFSNVLENLENGGGHDEL